MPIASATPAEEFREQFARRAMVTDRAMGTMLYSRGVFINRCFNELKISKRDMLRQIHQEYVKAVAQNLAGAIRRLAARSIGKTIRHGDLP